VNIPLVLQSTWAAGESVGYVFANWQTTPQFVTLSPRDYLKRDGGHRLSVHDDRGTRILQKSGALPGEVRIEVPALSALMVEQGPEQR
jgi:hypothetical protein